MTPARRAGVGAILALGAVAFVVMVEGVGQIPPALTLSVMFLCALGGGLLCAGLAGRSGTRGVALTAVAVIGTLIFGAAIFGLLVSPPAGLLFGPVLVAWMAVNRSVAVLALIAAGVAAHGLARVRISD